MLTSKLAGLERGRREARWETIPVGNEAHEWGLAHGDSERRERVCVGDGAVEEVVAGEIAQMAALDGVKVW